MCIYINFSINNCYSWSSGSWWDRHPGHHLPEQSMWILASWTWPQWYIIKIPKSFWWFFKTYCKMRTIFNLIDIVEKMYSFDNFRWIEEVIYHLVTSSTWCAQALFLRIGASPCQITKMCSEKQFVRFSKVFKSLTFRPFGVSTPTRPYWILLLWKLVTKLSRSPWVGEQNVKIHVS